MLAVLDPQSTLTVIGTTVVEELDVMVSEAKVVVEDELVLVFEVLPLPVISFVELVLFADSVVDDLVSDPDPGADDRPVPLVVRPAVVAFVDDPCVVPLFELVAPKLVLLFVLLLGVLEDLLKPVREFVEELLVLVFALTVPGFERVVAGFSVSDVLPVAVLFCVVFVALVTFNEFVDDGFVEFVDALLLVRLGSAAVELLKPLAVAFIIYLEVGNLLLGTNDEAEQNAL
ncbi:MAG: hypothetical protein Q9165_008470 [Trypethelium subeluteriae]